MSHHKIYVKVIRNGALLPQKKSANAGAFDLSIVLDKPYALQPAERFMAATGLQFEIPEGYIVSVRPRSGLAAKEGVTLVNSPGTIDSDYRGEVMIPLINLSKKEFVLTNHMRVAQALLEKVNDVEWIQKEELSKTERGEGGFGSTGKF